MAEISALTPSPPAMGDPHASPSMPSNSHPAPCSSDKKEPPLPKSSLYNDKSLKAASPAPPPKRQASPAHQTQVQQGPPLVPPKPVQPKLPPQSPVLPPVDGAVAQSEGMSGTDVQTGPSPGVAGEMSSDQETSELLKADPASPAEGQGLVAEQTTPSPDLNPTPNLYPSVRVTHNHNPATDGAAQSALIAPPAPTPTPTPPPSCPTQTTAATDTSLATALATDTPLATATDTSLATAPTTVTTSVTATDTSLATALAEDTSLATAPTTDTSLATAPTTDTNAALIPEEETPQPPRSPHPQTPTQSPRPDTPSRMEHPPSSPLPVIHEPAASVCVPSPRPRPAPDTLSYLESASLESLSGLGEDGSSVGSDSEINGMAVRRTDKYGFLGGTQYSDGSDKDTRVDVARQREMKWLEMFNNWDKWVARRFPKVKMRCRKGIPSSLRCKAWQLLSNSKELLDNNPGKFEELERETGDPKWLDIIEKDLHRQFPFHEMFVARGGHGQQDLYRVLKAYTIYRPDEGYCQAQAPVAAVLLMHMPAEQAFWCLVQICEKYLPGYYSAGLEAIQLDGEIFFSLLRRVCPMAYRHLKKFKIDPILYMTEWFMCVFSRTLPWPCVLRVWDMFFCEGVKIVFRVGLVLLKQMLGSVEKLRAVQGMYETMERLRNIPPESVREDVLVQEVVMMPVTEALIERECSVQVRKWRESRGELTHQPGLRHHGTRAIHEYKRRAASISSGGSFSFLGSSIPPPGALRASSSLLSLPGFRKSKTPFHSQPKKGSFSGASGVEGLPPLRPSAVASGPSRASVHGAPASQSPLVASSSASPSSGPVSAPPASSAVPAPAQNQAPPNTLSPVVVSEQVTPSIPSPTANNAVLPPCPDGGRAGAAGGGGGGDDDGKKKKKSKDDKKKGKEEEKQKLKEKKELKEKEKADKERQKKEKERAEKEKKKEKGGKKKDKGGGEAEEKNGAAAAKDSA